MKSDASSRQGWPSAIALSMLVHCIVLVALSSGMGDRPRQLPSAIDVDLVGVQSAASAMQEQPAPASQAPVMRPARAPAQRAPRTVTSAAAVQVSAPASIETSDVASSPTPSAPAMPATNLTPDTMPVAIDASRASVELHLLDWLEEHRRYPRSARRAGLQGRVELAFVVDRVGRISALRLVRSSGHDVLDRAALDLVRRAAPFPDMPAIGPGQVEVALPIEYRLDPWLAGGKG